MRFKILDTKWKRKQRLAIILMILYQGPIDELHFDAIYNLTIKALDLDWIHPNY